VLSAGHARALLTVEDSAAQERLAQRVVAEGLSVRATEELVTLGQGGATEERTRTRHRREPSPRAAEIADQLSDRLETTVRVDAGKSRGRITIDFATDDDLERIAALINSSI
jgi:ParB family chromosome partitioning protein